MSRKFSPAEIGDRRVKGLYFKCDEKFTPGHKEDCKRVFTIELLDEADPMIFIHALTGIQSRSAKMTQVFMLMGSSKFMALLDSGLTHSFNDTVAAARAGIVFQGWL
jgi:hypothetical protein